MNCFYAEKTKGYDIESTESVVGNEVKFARITSHHSFAETSPNDK